jgi:hypothetical protein
MPRRLSDIEWATFLHDVNVPALNLPPWGGVVDWGGEKILVYIGPTGEVFTTDISDRPDLLQNIAASYDPTSQIWYYQLPQAVMQTVVEEAQATGQFVKSTITEIANIIGQAAGDVTKPIIDNLTPILIGAAVLLGLMYLPRKK